MVVTLTDNRYLHSLVLVDTVTSCPLPVTHIISISILISNLHCFNANGLLIRT